jgi:AcrR family transcriptional regulator
VPPVKQRTPELRDRVLQAAVALLDEDGVEAFTARRVAAAAATSTPAVYELFGDKAGLVREVCFEGFRRLGARFAALRPVDDPVRALVAVVGAYRAFAREQPALAAVMFSRPFADFDPGPDEHAAGRSVREVVVGHVRRGIAAGRLAGDATDIAHVVLALAQGLAAQEAAGWLGTSRASVDRRWRTGVRALLAGFTPRPPAS